MSESVPSLNKQLYDGVAELATLTDELRLAQARAQEARHHEIAALNRLNDAQNRFDGVLAELKKLAPRESDWQRSSHKGLPA